MVGLSVYNDKNESLGSINDLLTDKNGNIKAVVIGVGGFLGVGEHLVAIPFEKVKFVNEPIVYTGAGERRRRRGRRTAGSTTTTGAASTAPAARGEAESVVSGSRRVQRHQGRAEGDARVQIRDLRQHRSLHRANDRNAPDGSVAARRIFVATGARRAHRAWCAASFRHGYPRC